MPGFMPYSAVEKEKVIGKKGKGKKGKKNRFNRAKGKKNFAEIYGKK